MYKYMTKCTNLFCTANIVENLFMVTHILPLTAELNNLKFNFHTLVSHHLDPQL